MYHSSNGSLFVWCWDKERSDTYRVSDARWRIGGEERDYSFSSSFFAMCRETAAARAGASFPSRHEATSSSVGTQRSGCASAGRSHSGEPKSSRGHHQRRSVFPVSTPICTRAASRSSSQTSARSSAESNSARETTASSPNNSGRTGLKSSSRSRRIKRSHASTVAVSSRSGSPSRRALMASRMRLSSWLTREAGALHTASRISPAIGCSPELVHSSQQIAARIWSTPSSSWKRVSKSVRVRVRVTGLLMIPPGTWAGGQQCPQVSVAPPDRIGAAC